MQHSLESCAVLSHSVVSDSLQSHGLLPTRLQARILEWVAFPSLGHLPHPGIVPPLQVDSLPLNHLLRLQNITAQSRQVFLIPQNNPDEVSNPGQVSKYARPTYPETQVGPVILTRCLSVFSLKA